MRSVPTWLWATLVAVVFSLSEQAEAAERDRNSYRLWGGQATIRLPAVVKVSREKTDRYAAELRGKSSGREVQFQRGQIPRKYNRVSTVRMGAIARDRLKGKSYDIHDFRVAGRTVTILFGGEETVKVQTPRGPLEVKVPWRAQLRWIRQTDHQTYQSVLKMPLSEWQDGSNRALERVASSLRVPRKKVSRRDRLKDAAAAAPLAGQRVGSWFPGWNL